MCFVFVYSVELAVLYLYICTIIKNGNLNPRFTATIPPGRQRYLRLGILYNVAHPRLWFSLLASAMCYANGGRKGK